MLELLGGAKIFAASWIMLLIWVAIAAVFGLRTNPRQFLYWDLLFAAVLALTMLSTTSFQALRLGSTSAFVLLPAMIYFVADEAENITALMSSAEPTIPTNIFILTPAKFALVGAANLVIVVQLPLLIFRRLRHEG